MAWTKQTKATTTNKGWGQAGWGSSRWGSPSGYVNWAKQTKPTDTWTKQTKVT